MKLKTNLLISLSLIFFAPESSALEFVDLGLGVNWAVSNLGASDPSATGSLFAWGATEPVPYYDWAYYPLCKGHFNELSKYNFDPAFGSVDGKTTLENVDDAASVILGDDWRIPTDEEWRALIEECEWKEGEYNGTKGFYVISRKPGYEGNSIFLPFAPSKSGGEIHSSNLGYYWSATLDTRSSWCAIGVSFYQGTVERPVFGRFLGMCIRPVKKLKK